MEKGKEAKSQRKLAGKIGTSPENFSDVKHGKVHFGGKRARRAAKILDTDPMIWVSGATDRELKDRLKAVDAYLGHNRV